MNKYDITIITKDDLGVEPVKKEIESLSGKILNSQSLGQKKFSFNINKEPAGFYTSIIFEIDPDKLIELNKKLALKTDILRFLILIYQEVSVAAPQKKELEAEKITDKKIDEKVEEITEKAIEKQDSKIVGETKKEESLDKTLDKEKITPEKPKKASKKEKIETEVEEKKESKATKEIEEEAVSTEERLKALDKKLDELLKE